MRGICLAGLMSLLLTSIVAAQEARPSPKSVHPIPLDRPLKPLHAPKADYPALAKKARIQGKVELEALIGRDGKVKKLRVLSGHPLLAQAALEAVKKWCYKPTLIEGEPVEVVTLVEVPFRLDNAEDEKEKTESDDDRRIAALPLPCLTCVTSSVPT